VFKATDKFYVGMCHTQADAQQTVPAFEAAVARVGANAFPPDDARNKRVV
jgi:hypothetical protein